MLVFVLGLLGFIGDCPFIVFWAWHFHGKWQAQRPEPEKRKKCSRENNGFKEHFAKNRLTEVYQRILVGRVSMGFYSSVKRK